ncbi:formate/nitrite transporter family protein [Psychrilyobacter atlanticus]|uniref:formate/nitrite transporter family protein n=1 Tax=Psychrilyobacter atlanticus TaxID=271091 RepID=UPI000416E8F5|nr:formate/nitrite transporter family protein [Psychrilyobacter atlanticus]
MCKENMYDNYETAGNVVKMGIKKANSKSINIFLFGILGGFFIALGYMGYMTVTQTMRTRVDTGLASFLGASVFPVGIMLCIVVGGSLFTSNNLLTLALFDKKISLKDLFRNWTFVWLGNFTGSIIAAVLAITAGLYKSEAIYSVAVHMAEHKAVLGFSEAVASAFFCNVLVALGVWMTMSAKDLVSKVIGVWFPVMLFVLCGFQHVVANMYVLSLGKMLGANYTLGEMFMNNIIPVTIGNALSGGLIFPAMYYFLLVKKQK